MLLNAQVFLFHLTSVSSNVIWHFTSCSSTWTPLLVPNFYSLILIGQGCLHSLVHACTCIIIDLARAKSEALDNICSLFKQSMKSCNAKWWRQRRRMVKKTTIGLISKKATLHVLHTFFVHFFAAVLHDNDSLSFCWSIFLICGHDN